MRKKLGASKNRIRSSSYFFFSFITLAALIVFSGCIIPDGGTKSDKVHAAGVKARFALDAPYDTINQKEEFKIQPCFSNEGDFNVARNMANVEILGVSGIFKVTGGKKEKRLNEEIEKGLDGEAMVGDVCSEPIKAKYVADMKGDKETTEVRARICYPYKTESSGQICNGKISKDCDAKLAKNSYSPVQTTSISQKNVGENIRVSIRVKNNGGEQVYVGPAGDCENERETERKVKVSEIKIARGGGWLDITDKCVDSDDRTIKLEKDTKDRVIECKEVPRTMGDRTSKTETLKVTLNYNYIADVRKDVTFMKTEYD